ncbi:MAG: VOC family protein [Candidatus Dojkabacteria bacterium]
MAKLRAYLFFPGNTKEGMEFYKSVFGGELVLTRVGDTPAAQGMPPETHDSILHSDLTSGDLVLYASDQNDPKTMVQGNTVSLCLVCSSDEEIQSLYDKLMVGGTSEHPLKKEFFGWFGDCVDKYGFRWMFELDKEKTAN